VFRGSAGFSIQATSANVAAFKTGASVKLADGQVRKVLRTQVVGSNLSVFLEGAAINGAAVGYPKTVSVVSTSATPSAPSVTTPPAAVAPAPSPAPSAPSTTNGKPLLVGVNLSGAGFGPSVVPGTHGTNYTYPAESYYKKYADLGMPLVRLPFLWERIQPKLNTPLNATELARLKQSLDFRAEAQRQGDPRPAQLLPLFQQADRLERSTHQLIRGGVEADCAGSGQPPGGGRLRADERAILHQWSLAAGRPGGCSGDPHRGFQALDLRGR